MPKRIILIFAFSLVLFSVLLMYLLRNDSFSNSRSNAYESAEWQESYLVADSNPRGLSIFNELLEYRTKKTSTFIFDDFKKKDLNKINTTYIFVGKSFQLKTAEFDSILKKVEKGSNLFIAYDAISENIYEHFFYTSEFLWDYSDRQYVDYIGGQQALKLCPVHQLDTVAMTWNFFPLSDTVEWEESQVESITSLSSIKGYCNMMDAKIGKGHVYLHSNPELFQNYQLLSRNGYTYNKWMVDLIPVDHQVKWLELGRIDEETGAASDDKGDEGQKDTSYLQFIFNNLALTIALLVALLGVILYLIFRTKRSQPLVPYLPKTANYSLAFAETIKEIYYKQQTPFSILKVMRKNFFVAVNKQFFIDLSKAEKQEELKLLAEKSGVDLKQINILMKKFETREPTLVDYEYLKSTSELQQQFYRDTGIIKQKQFDRVMAKAQRINRPMWGAILLIFTGIFSILYGFYMLFLAYGVGIVLWPLGILLLIFGIRMLMLPLLKIEQDNVTFYSLLGFKKKYKKEQITHVEIGNGSTRFTTEDNQFYVINHSHISLYDRSAFEQFISPFIKDQL